MPADPDKAAAGAPQTALRPRPRPSGLGPQSNATVTHEATLHGKLPMNRTTLIGVVDRPEGATAFLREADGTIRKVAAGDRVGALNVVKIAAQSVQLDIGGLAVVLSMPS